MTATVTLPLAPFPSPVPFQKPDVIAIYTRGNDNVLQQAINAILGTTQTITSDTTQVNTDRVVFIDATSNNVTYTLLDAATVYPSLPVYLKRTDASGNTVTISGTVDGSADPTLASLDARAIASDGTAWYFIGVYP